ncbi:hypothetical protein C8A03DRAFT_34434 [Achaetomium macrosporum]|uniref:Uncharacterized protein n=1 Tax=Achaetomium macrosporum TaxID=79813 RepID=A0AAN7C9Q7_9PEZI|nr:hypothetical protein C8A03DRAFT_34434 [Achaetomium macrosporum]
MRERPFWFYMVYVRMYTGRKLTKPRDVLAAFEGITWLLGQFMEAPMLFGFPTWSWAGWMNGTIEYNRAMLDGCLTDVHEWLTRHTWIQWHIRDEKGHLQPLCGIMTQKPQRSKFTSEIQTEDGGQCHS